MFTGSGLPWPPAHSLRLRERDGMWRFKCFHNVRAPDLSRNNFSGSPNIKGTYKNLEKIRNKIQNDSPEFQYC
jgi:hypothetical protein